MSLKVSLSLKLKHFLRNKYINFFLTIFTILYLILHINYLITNSKKLIFESFHNIAFFHIGLLIFYLLLFFFTNQNKLYLKNKIFSGINEYLLSIYFLGISFYSFYEFFIVHIDSQILFDEIIDYAILLVLILYLIKIIIEKSVNKHICKRFNLIQNQIEEIKNGDISKRLEIFGVDEIDRMFYFVNDLLDELENKIKFEKKFSLIDPLTKCFNRRGLNLNFLDIKKESIRDKNNFSIVLLDLDKFKDVNDTCGHDIGDKVLIEFSNLINKTIRPTDSLYRLGGEEFLILFPKSSKTNCEIILQRLAEEVRKKIIRKISKLKTPITFSGGFANSRNFKLSNSKILDIMIKKTDDLLYKAKNSGRDKVLFE